MNYKDIPGMRQHRLTRSSPRELSYSGGQPGAN